MTQLYQLTRYPTTIRRISDNAFIPTDPANNDFIAYQAWLAEGNTPDPLPIPPSDPLSDA